MSITEKTAYLKGLLEGLNIDTGKPEGKLLKAVRGLVCCRDVTVKSRTEHELVRHKRTDAVKRHVNSL